MRALILALAVASVGFGSGAQAQKKPMYDDPGAPPALTEEQPAGPRVYGDSQRDPAPGPDAGMIELDRPSGPGGCGQFFFWDGDRCVDARSK